MTLQLRSIQRKVAGEMHLADVDLTLERGSLNVLLGPTRSGKTSLMRIMAGLDVPTAGTISVDGKDVTGQHVRQRSVAMVYQQFINYPAMTVYENIASPLRVKRMAAAEIDRKVRSAAELVKLGPYLDRLPLTLSGGQQQRCALARALVKESALVLLDEPLANLDYKLREELREELPRIFRQSGAIFVYATTEPAEALLLGGSTVCLSEGRLVAHGPTAATYRHPASLKAAEVFSDPPLNRIPVESKAGALSLRAGGLLNHDGVLGAPPTGFYTLAVRAHHLALEPRPGASIQLEGKVEVSEITGSESFVHVLANDLRLVVLVPGVRDLPPGQSVKVHCHPRDVFLFDAHGLPAGGGAQMQASSPVLAGV